MSSEPPNKKRWHALPKFTLVKAPGAKKNVHQYVCYSIKASSSLSTSFSTILNEVQNFNLTETELPENNWAVTCDEEVDFDFAIDESYLQHLDELEPEEKTRKIWYKGYITIPLTSLHGWVIFQNESLWDFEPEIDLFLEELINLESQGCWPSERCVCCTTALGIFQCHDYSGREMVCQTCIVDSHKKIYLHQIQVSCDVENIEI